MATLDTSPRVGVLMGSDSDWPVMQAAVATLERFGVGCEARVLSAHRTPGDVGEYARTAYERGLRVVICGAGMAAHLAGVVAAWTPLPVIAVPIAARQLDGMDALLASVQMPKGVPVATVAIGGAENAGLLAVQILATSDERLYAAFQDHKAKLASDARAKTLPRE
ncbi:MAG: 5-(carboxyamino)imidazole ribonucleotide mutase [Deltaproteobacteria bacterium]|nr:5-(carboxyamino)imidazole ribonucleotide mutase [Deltaproteobacteria bacterium]MCB9785950.1 5-(carboxyamino)imidazole ribonucleotide mutase [Deltaproteobacteria bacterium]